MNLSIQVTKGMAHLVLNGVLHRDLAARNVLVKMQGSEQIPMAKLCDFGLGKMLAENNYYTVTTPGVALPVKWTAPEAMLQKKFSEASDAWSFGVVMWEMYSRGEEPYALWLPREIIRNLQSGERLKQPRMCPDQVFSVVQLCWSLDRKARPTFAELFQLLNSLEQEQSDKYQELLYGDGDGGRLEVSAIYGDASYDNYGT